MKNVRTSGDMDIDERYTVKYIEHESYLIMFYFSPFRKRRNRFGASFHLTTDLDKRIMRNLGICPHV
jgi:hypothetical protein